MPFPSPFNPVGGGNSITCFWAGWMLVSKEKASEAVREGRCRARLMCISSLQYGNSGGPLVNLVSVPWGRSLGFSGALFTLGWAAQPRGGLGTQNMALVPSHPTIWGLRRRMRPQACAAPRGADAVRGAREVSEQQDPVPVVGLGQGTRVRGRSPHHRVDGRGAGLATHLWGWCLGCVRIDTGGVLQERWGRGVCRAPLGGAASRSGVSGDRSGQAAPASWRRRARQGGSPARKGQTAEGAGGCPDPTSPHPASRKRG